ncbi:T9SS type A sorting domain-containing protein [Pseudopedobacter beijingensis]|uniref:T9SS type A sorting domain-containing protein n=1 Tax=Pseudopedobacter beijingensis TaxID=1207056 RepID=A0ABW4IJ55_9SPHI
MNRFLLLLIGLLCAVQLKGQLLKVEFKDGTALNSYYSNAPTSNQLSNIDVSNDYSSVSIESGMLKMKRTSDATSVASFSRITPFANSPKLLICEFDLKVEGNAKATTTAATFLLGSNFTKANNTEAVDKIHSRFSINLSENEGEFFLKESGNKGVIGTALTGKCKVKFIVNNLGESYTYISDDKEYSLANDQWDLWVNGEKYLSGKEATTAGQELENMKFFFDKGIASIFVGDVIVYGLEALPVGLLSFEGKALRNGNQLTWCIASAENLQRFEIHRSKDGVNFSSWKSVSYQDGFFSYRVEDMASEGISYYKLIAVDGDGVKTELKTIYIKSSAIYAMDIIPVIGDILFKLSEENKSVSSVRILDVKGAVLCSKAIDSQSMDEYISLGVDLPKGVYILSTLIGSEWINKKFIK